MVGNPKRFRVCYVVGGRLYAFTVHSREDALFWAVHIRERWRDPAWIDREDAPSVRND